MAGFGAPKENDPVEAAAGVDEAAAGGAVDAGFGAPNEKGAAGAAAEAAAGAGAAAGARAGVEAALVSLDLSAVTASFRGEGTAGAEAATRAGTVLPNENGAGVGVPDFVGVAVAGGVVLGVVLAAAGAPPPNENDGGVAVPVLLGVPRGTLGVVAAAGGVDEPVAPPSFDAPSLDNSSS